MRIKGKEMEDTIMGYIWFRVCGLEFRFSYPPWMPHISGVWNVGGPM